MAIGAAVSAPAPHPAAAPARPARPGLARPGPPLWLLLELTYRCPLHCAFCYNPTDFARTGPELATEDWLRVLREARALGAVQLGLSGGEPLSRDDLEPIVEEAHRLGFYTNLITSGVGLTETRIRALKTAGLDHIQLSFQDSTRQMNDFLSSTRTFDLKSKVAALIKQHDYPMVLNVVLHRLNIDHVQEILEMAERMGADYVELANTQFYGWAWHNREQLMPSRAQIERAEEATRRFRERADRPMRIFFVVPDYFERRPKACMNGLGSLFLTVTPDGTALPCHAARMLAGPRVPEREERERRAHLVRIVRLPAFSRRCLDERAVPELPGEGPGLRRMPLPGLFADRRCGECGSGVRSVAASSSGDRGGRARGPPDRGREAARIPHAGQFVYAASMISWPLASSAEAHGAVRRRARRRDGRAPLARVAPDRRGARAPRARA